MLDAFIKEGISNKFQKYFQKDVCDKKTYAFIKNIKIFEGTRATICGK